MIAATLATAALAAPRPAAAQSFSLDDNPSAPLDSTPGSGLGAEDEFGLSGGPGLAPSPSVATAVVGGAGDGTIFSVTIGGLQHVPDGSYVDAFSTNKAGVNRPITLQFSVDRLTTGLGAVGSEAGLGEQMGDIFESTAAFPKPSVFAGTLGAGPFAGILSSAGVGGSNVLDIDESDFGLVTPGVIPVTPGTTDNIDAYDAASQVPDPILGIPFGVYTGDSYFAVAPDQAAITGTSAADIFATPALTFGASPAPYALSPSLGLDILGPNPNTDSIDALIMFDNNLTPSTGAITVEPGTDYALFSLAPGSATLATLGLSANDVFFTDFTGAFGLYAFAADLGLLAGAGGAPLTGHNIDALELNIIPEPASVVSMLLGLAGVAGLGLHARRRSRPSC